MRKMFISTLVVATFLMAGASFAGELNSLVMRYEGPAPVAYPIDVTLYVWEGGNCDHLKATTTATFDGVNVSNIVCHAFACITDITVVGSEIIISFDVLGYDAGKFKADTCFEVTWPGFSAIRKIHTSCSQPVFLDVAYIADPAGAFFIDDGVGTCLYSGDYPTDCVQDDKLHWLAGEFWVPCTCPAQVTFRFCDSDAWSTPRGTATAYFDCGVLQNSYNDRYALLWGARMEAGYMVVSWEAFGFDGTTFKFKTETSFELIVDGCGVFRYRKLHTSCSRPIPVAEQLPLYQGEGMFVITNYCGCNETSIPVEQETWGSIKSMYR